MLLEANLIDEVQMKVALAEQTRTGLKFGSQLVELKFIDENVLAAFLSKQIDIPCISLLHVDIPRKIVRKISPLIAHRCHAVPVRLDHEHLEVAMSDPTDIDLLQILENESGMTVSPLVAPQSSIEKMLGKLYPIDDDTTLASQPEVPAPEVADPHFRDLIEDLETGDFDARLERIERRLDEVWTLLERVLRHIEQERIEEHLEKQ